MKCISGTQYISLGRRVQWLTKEIGKDKAARINVDKAKIARTLISSSKKNGVLPAARKNTRVISPNSAVLTQTGKTRKENGNERRP